MNDNNNKKKNSRGASITTRDMLGVTAIILVLFLTVLFIALNLQSENSTMAIQDRYQSFSSGWTLTHGDSTEVVTLPVHVEVGANETITISKELPTISQFYATASRNYHQKMFAYVDDELIYEFPKDSRIFSRAAITDDWNLIRLNEDMSGKLLKIEFQTGSYGFSGNINPVYLGEDNTIVQYIRAETSIPYAMSISVIALGVTLIVLGIIYSKYNKDRTQIISGLMLVTIGIWITNRSKMPLLLTGSSIKYFLAFISLLMETVLILLYVWEKFKDKKQHLTGRLIIIASVYLAAILIISLTMSYPIDQMVKYVYGSIFLASLYMLIMLWPVAFGKESKRLSQRQRTTNRMEFFAANIMTFGVVIGIIFDFFMNNNRLWTDIGAISKIVLNIYAITQISIHIYRSYNNVIESEEIKGQLHNSQLELMMGQIQPHFIFNTLSSIRTLVKVEPDLAYNMIYDFSNYLRANVDNMTNMNGINFSSELEHIKSYVNIEKVRFGERLTVEYDPQYTDFNVPPLSIQPIVENAIKHGVCKRPEGGTVWLRSYIEGNHYVVEVEDNGIGFSPEFLESLNEKGSLSEEDSTRHKFTGNGSKTHKSTGMRNIILRLKEMANADLKIESTQGVGTKIRVFFPIETSGH